MSVPHAHFMPSDAELLRMALAGSDDEWTRLHFGCSDRQFAEAFAKALESALSAQRERVNHWLEVIHDIHPDLDANGVSSTPQRLSA